MSLPAIIQSVPVIDFHVHAFPDDVAPRALEALFGHGKCAPNTDGTAQGLSDAFNRAGISLGIVQPVATKPSQVKGINDWAAGINSSAPGNVISFGGIHKDFHNPADEIERIITLGIAGVKIHGNWQDYYVDDRAMYPIYEAAQGRLIALFHSGCEIAPVPQDRATPGAIANIARDFPNLTIVVAHMGGYRMWDEAEERLIGKNVYIDTSASFRSEMTDERFVGLIRKHGSERALFATDMPLGNPEIELERIATVGLSDDELENILYKNAARLLGDKLPHLTNPPQS